ncbi:MAG: hypothetical protein LAN18_05105 [Acidobacteriia bacterium]|nr:hypothetical protein [Terriglobia bacterium]
MKRAEETTQQIDAKFSAQSRKNLFQQDLIQSRIRDVQNIRSVEQREIDELSGYRKDWHEASLKPKGETFIQYVHDADADLKRLRERTQSCDEHIAELEAEKAKLIPSSEQAHARAERQQLLASLAIERLGKDREIAKVLANLRSLLGERSGLTAKMMEIVPSIDFTVDGDLDARPFNDLLAALPSDLAGDSERWLDWFLGSNKIAKPYVVRDERLVVAETLANAGIYQRGERIELSDERAVELLRENRPSTDTEKHWRRLPPSIITLENYEAALASAEKAGCSVQDLWAQEDIARFHEQDRDWIERFQGQAKALSHR